MHKRVRSQSSFMNMKEEPLLNDECSSCIMHETSIKEKDAQINQLKQAILLQYSADDTDE